MPISYRNETLNLISDEVNLHAGEAVVQEDQQGRLLLQLDLPLIPLKAELHDSVEEFREVIPRLLEGRPCGHAFSKLLVDHDHDGHDVGHCALNGIEIRPQVVFQILK